MKWVREHLAALLGALSALLLGALAWGSMRRRETSLKASVATERAKATVAVATHEADRQVVAAETAGKRADALHEQVDAVDKRLEADQHSVDGLSQTELVQKLNKLYYRSHGHDRPTAVAPPPPVGGGRLPPPPPVPSTATRRPPVPRKR